MNTRRCVKCKKDKPASDFSKEKSGKSYKATCEHCLSMYRDSWNRKHTQAVDPRDTKHPLDEVCKTWRSTACSAAATATSDTACSSTGAS